ncbi:nuclear RNA export factor 1-like isoform X1 [Echinops telfairi]|uniref:Nuclear RNA export factor 1-like isoform X1 n=1 Tax=Echinops telfairi TaxID=9371 RepID=A0AC55D497_ECHTE|nr:nuclear RNA export factor 1-like isoform X1 [Echinops telfairi]
MQKELVSKNGKLNKGIPTAEVTKIKGVEGCQGALDLPQEVHSDSEGVMHHAAEMGLNGRKDTASSLQFLEENMPKLLSFTSSNSRHYQLVGLANMGQKDPTMQSRNLFENQMKAEGEMDTVKGLEPGEMSAGRKPLCTSSPHKPSDVRGGARTVPMGAAQRKERRRGAWREAAPSSLSGDLLDLFPKLLSPDDPVLPPPLFSDIGNDKKLPFCKGSVFGSETLKDLVWKFLTQYYRIYDGGDRQGLLSAYHDNACFSLTTLFHTEDPSRISCSKSSKDSGAVKEFKDIGLCVLLVKRTKSEIVDFLRVLPKTQHDLSSFVVDVGAQMRTTLCFSVRGKFKETEGLCGPPLCAFTRTFLLRTGSDASIYIINDQLTVTHVSPKEPQSSCFSPVPTPSSSFEPTTSQEQQKVQ